MSGRISGYIIGPAFSEGGCYHQRREVLQRAFDRTGAPVASTVDQLHDLLQLGQMGAAFLRAYPFVGLVTGRVYCSFEYRTSKAP